MSSSVEKYFVPEPSHFPIFGSLALLLIGTGAAMWMNKVLNGQWVLAAGFAVLLYMLFGWFGQVIRESESGQYGKQVDRAFRWSMGWFIFSEVMFFVAFFGVLFYVRVLSVPELGSAEQALLWDGFTAAWPSAGPLAEEAFTPMHDLFIPALNTGLLLTSGLTLTFAHWALLKGQRTPLKIWLFLTIVLGLVFLGFQAYEYMHAYSALNLKLNSGVYGSSFYMLTGFHGLHVTIGATMLIVMFVRVLKGHFTAERHFAFEAVAWYWHFVDVVWLLLFVVVYWL